MLCFAEAESAKENGRSHPSDPENVANPPMSFDRFLRTDPS